jgi:hypothetical protein
LPEHKPVKIRLRAFVIGLALIPVAGFWIFGGEMGGFVRRYTFATWAAPFYNAIYILLVLSLLNLPLRKRLPRLALNHLELLVIYIMVSVGSALISSDLQGVLVTLMGYPTYFADSSNNWDKLFAGALPTWLMVTDKQALVGFYQGNSSFFRPENYTVWIKPILAWTLFIWAMLMAMLCINTILRKAWIERERLTFPIVALPVAMTEDPEAFFSNKLMWIGFAIAGGITLINGLAFMYPNVPYIPIKRVDYQVAAAGPFAAMGSIRVAFYFFAITLGFLMPVDLSFSLYFFYILYKLQAVAVNMIGIPPESRFPYTGSQSFGAYIAIFLAAIWGLKHHLRNVWRIAMGRGNPDEDADEPMRYRSAIIWLGLCSAVLLVFSRLAGMKPQVAIIFFALYLVVCVIVTRLRAEFGLPVHQMYQVAPHTVMLSMVSNKVFDDQTLGSFSLFYWFNRVYRSHPMPHQMEGMKLAGNAPGAQRSMFRAMLIAGMVAVPVCFLVYLNGFYHWGAATAHINQWGTGYGREATSMLENTLKNHNVPDAGEKVAAVFGFGVALAMSAMRARFVGFPFHPLGYAVASEWGMQNLWLPIMIGSLCKAGVLRAGGLQGYRKAVMLFFGLMLGEFAVGCSWTLYGLIMHVPTYDFWP